MVKPPRSPLNHNKTTKFSFTTPNQLFPPIVYSSCVAPIFIYKVKVWWIKINPLYSTFLMGCTSVRLSGVFMYSLSKYSYYVHQILQGKWYWYRCICLLIIFCWYCIHFIIEQLWHIIVDSIYAYHVGENYNYIHNVIGTIWPFTMGDTTIFQPTNIHIFTRENNLIGKRYHFPYIWYIYVLSSIVLKFRFAWSDSMPCW